MSARGRLLSGDLAGVGELPLTQRPHRIGRKRNDGDGLASEGCKLNFVSAAVLVDHDDRTDITRFQVEFGLILD